MEQPAAHRPERDISAEEINYIDKSTSVAAKFLTEETISPLIEKAKKESNKIYPNQVMDALFPDPSIAGDDWYGTREGLAFAINFIHKTFNVRRSDHSLHGGWQIEYFNPSHANNEHGNINLKHVPDNPDEDVLYKTTTLMDLITTNLYNPEATKKYFA